MKILDELDRREKRIYLIAGISLIVIAATGILLWRINQEEKLSSEESEAAGSVVCGGECVNDSDCKGWNDGSGNVECNQGSSHRCEIYKCSSGYVIGPSKCACIPSGGIKCGSYGCAGDADCEGGSGTDPSYECNNRADGDITKQQCIRIKCPTGYKVDDDNCSCVLTVENKCDGGGWTNKPSSFTTDESFTMSGYAQDTDGIDLTSIAVKINNTSLSSSKITKKEDSDTKASWSTILSGYTAGSYTTTVTWKDKKGTGGSSCTLTATFTVTEATEEEVCKEYWDITDNACVLKEKCVANSSIPIEVEINGITTFSTRDLCQSFLSSDHWQVENNECVLVDSLSDALAKFNTEGLEVFSSLSACQTTLDSTPSTPTVTPTTPQTGLLDEAWGKIALGFGILAVGMLLTKHDVFELDWTGVRVQGEINKTKKKGEVKNGFEKRVVKGK